MSAPAYLTEGAIYLTAAVIAVPLFKRLGLGSVLGYLIAGIIIGPSALQLISDPERVIHFAEFGVVMLLFLIGLELEPKQAWRLRKPIFGLGGVQVVLTLAVAFGAAVAMGFSWQVGLVAAMGIAMSSTAIGLANLQEKRLVGHGRRRSLVCRVVVSRSGGDSVVYGVGVAGAGRRHAI